jgi:hypothetical protein
MSTYNNNRFTPGNKSKLRQFINKEIIRQNYRTSNSSQSFDNDSDITKGDLCGCIEQKSNLIKQGWNDYSQTENQRVARILTGTLGGKITYGNFNRPVNINYLGSWEGQPGGSFRPLRNKF